MKPSIFLSHNAKDKKFVRKLALDLDCHGIKVWLDEAELKVGDSLIEKIREGIDGVDYVVSADFLPYERFRVIGYWYPFF